MRRLIAEELYGPGSQTAGGCYVVLNADDAHELLGLIRDTAIDDVYGFDLESVGWNPKKDKRPPCGRAIPVCWSIAWNDGTLGNHPYRKHVPLVQRAFLVWTPEVIDVFREFLATEKFVAHNGPGFDMHAAENVGVTVNVAFDSMTMSKLTDNRPKLGHGLKRLMSERLGYEDRGMMELFNRPNGGAVQVREKPGRSTVAVEPPRYEECECKKTPCPACKGTGRKRVRVPKLLGTGEIHNVCWGQQVLIPLTEIIEKGWEHSRFLNLVDYASLDAKAHLECYYDQKQGLERNKLWKYYNRVWFPQQLVLHGMEREGWPFNPELCDRAVEELQARADELQKVLEKWGVTWTIGEELQVVYDSDEDTFVDISRPIEIPCAPNPNSDPQLKHLLYGRGVLEVAGVQVQGLGLPIPEVCGTPNAVKRTGRDKMPHDQMAFLTLAMDSRVRPGVRRMLEILLEYKGLLNDIGKFQRFAEAAREEPDGRLRYQLKCMTDTGRLSASNQPIQQVPKAGRLREAFIAPPGYKLIVADFSALEKRIAAHYLEVMFGDTSLRDDILSADPHGAAAKRIWPEHTADYTVEQLKKDDALNEKFRAPAKIVGYAVDYGKTGAGLGVQIRDPDTGERVGTEAGEKLLNDYITVAYPVIGRPGGWRDTLLKNAKADFCRVRTLHGRIRTLPGLQLDPNNWSEKWAYLADYRRLLNTPIQGSAADLVVMAMLCCNTYDHPRLRAEGWYNEKLAALGVIMLCQVHDELVFMVPEENANEALVEVKAGMENAMKLKIPTPVDAKVCDCWSEGK